MQGGGDHACLPQWVGRTLATMRYMGQLEPAVQGLLHQSTETFLAGTLRKTHSEKDGQYNSSIFNLPPGGHTFPALLTVNKKAPVLGMQALPFCQSNSHSRLLQQY